MLIVDRNYIEFNGQRIDRPSGWSVTQWFEYWKPLNKIQAAIDVTNRGDRAA